jgi:O-methyltransferase involved in polyketide biosynthesis
MKGWTGYLYVVATDVRKASCVMMLLNAAPALFSAEHLKSFFDAEEQQVMFECLNHL